MSGTLLEKGEQTDWSAEKQRQSSRTDTTAVCLSTDDRITETQSETTAREFYIAFKEATVFLR